MFSGLLKSMRNPFHPHNGLRTKNNKKTEAIYTHVQIMLDTMYVLNIKIWGQI